MGRFGAVHNGAGYFDPTSFVLYRIQNLVMRRINAGRDYFAQKPKQLSRAGLTSIIYPKNARKRNNYALGGWNTLPVKPTGR